MNYPSCYNMYNIPTNKQRPFSTTQGSFFSVYIGLCGLLSKLYDSRLSTLTTFFIKSVYFYFHLEIAVDD